MTGGIAVIASRCRPRGSSTRPRHLEGCFDAVPRISRFVELHEESLGIAIESAFAHLIRVDFHKSVVTPFLPHAKLKCAEVAGEGPRTRGVAAAMEVDLR